MSLKRICFYVLSMVIAVPQLMAQSTVSDTHISDSLSDKPIHHLGIDFHAGYIAAKKKFFHGDNAKNEPINKAISGQIRYSFQFPSDTRWGRMYPNTYQGIGLSYNTFFNKEELGNPIGIFIFQGSRIAELSPTLSFDYEWNFGASFGWKPMNKDENSPEYNPNNTAIGTKVNAYINIALMLNWKIGDEWRFKAGIDYMHFSNGTTHYPNAGVNAIGARIGLIRILNPEIARLPRHKDHTLDIEPHMSYDVVVYGTARFRDIKFGDETYHAKGPYAVWGFNFNPMYNINKLFKVGGSLDAQYDRSANLKEYVIDAEAEEKVFGRPPFQKQFGIGLSARMELVMPIFSVNLGVGHNIIYQGEDTKGFYQIFALKASVTKDFFLHIGYRLQDFRAPNNLMLGVGYRFHNKR